MGEVGTRGSFENSGKGFPPFGVALPLEGLITSSEEFKEWQDLTDFIGAREKSSGQDRKTRKVHA